MNATWLDSFVTPWRRRKVTSGLPASSRPGIHFMQLKNTSVRYRLAGEGDHTVVFCADPPVVLELYDELVEALAPHFRVIIFELPAFGFSLPGLGMDFELPRASEQVREFLEGLGAGPYILAFPCATAYTALWLAGHNPALVSGLVLMQAPDWPSELVWKQGRDARNVLGRPWLGQVVLRLLRRKLAAGWYRAALGRRDLLDSFTEETRKAFDAGAGFALASAFQRSLAGPEPAFAAVRQPALAIWGEADRSHRHTDPETIFRYLPQARLLRFEDVGHFPELEAPQRFATELQAMFGKHKDRSGL